MKYYLIDMEQDTQIVLKAKEGLKEAYKEFLLKEAEKRNIVINPHWYCHMNRLNHHPEMSEKEHNKSVKEWRKFQNKNGLIEFAVNLFDGKVVNAEWLMDIKA